jgi:predicted PurR-regulated permease PerM
MENNNSIIKITARLVLATLIILVLYVGKPFLVPLAWSLLIGLASVKFVDRVEAKTVLSRGMVIFLYLLLILVVIFSIAYFFYIELSQIFNDLPSISQKISDRLHDLSVALSGTGIHIPDHIDKQFISDWVDHHNGLLMSFISELGMNIWNIILIIFYLFFLLYYKDLVPYFFTQKVKNQDKITHLKVRMDKTMVLIRGYLYGLILVTLISAVMNYVVFLIFGLKFAVFFAFFLAILNLIPFIGNPIGLAVIILFSLITQESLLTPILIFVSLFIMNFIQDNVIRPLLIGDKMSINAFVVFISIIIGGMIWGVSGMILFIPIAGIVKIVLEGHDIHGPYAIFFSELPKKPKVQTQEEQNPQ